MKTPSLLLALVLSLVVALPVGAAAPTEAHSLPAPRMSGGMPLMDALKARQTTRSFSDKPISEQALSDLLWASWGINRENGKRTAPTARNSQEVQLYVVRQDGVWLYEAEKNALIPCLKEDVRSVFRGAPLTLLVATPEKDPWGGFHAGSVTQNAALFCASVGLGNVVKGSETNRLEGKLRLPAGYSIRIVQSIGWPER